MHPKCPGILGIFSGRICAKRMHPKCFGILGIFSGRICAKRMRQGETLMILPRRSILYVPGSNERALEKAKSLAADVLIYDLEDAVAPNMKETARENVCRVVKAGGFGFREIVVRINAPTTALGAQDLKEALAAKPNAILLPKVERAEDLIHVRKSTDAIAAGSSVALWAMIETPLALLNLKDIASAAACDTLPLTRFVLGTNDLVKATRLRNQGRIAPSFYHRLHSQWQLPAPSGSPWWMAFTIPSKTKSVSALNVNKAGGLAWMAKRLIHPAQIAICHEVFSPTIEEIEAARQIIEASLCLGGKMVRKGAINL